MSATAAWIHARSGLSWKELGLVFGVSSRAVHGWSTGMRTSPAQDYRIEAFAAIVREIVRHLDDPTPAAVRAELQRPDADGLNIVGRLRRERSGGPAWGAPFGPEYLIGAIRA